MDGGVFITWRNADIVRRSYEIAKRVRLLDPSRYWAETVAADIRAAIAAGCDLDLDAMLNATDVELMEDIAGITRHIDRSTGTFSNGFVPRFARGN